jgi:hypothetical protein
VSAPRTEADWLASSEPWELLRALRGRGKSRRLRLCATACCRRVAHLLPDERCRRAVDVAEAFADRKASKDQLAQAHDDIDRVLVLHGGLPTCAAAATLHAVGAALFAAKPEVAKWAVLALKQATAAIAYSRFPAETPYRATDPLLTEGMGDEQGVQAALVREVVRNPFRPPPGFVLPPSVLSIAQAAYDERLPSCELDPARLSVLADALEDAGCADDAILAHLRGPGPHVRGCWALDLVLGKA